MSLFDDFTEWQLKINSLIEEGQQLSARVFELEHQNIILQQRLADDQFGGFDALGKLYDDGYHICPASFGKSRDEDCLFCLNFLLHKGKKD